MQSPSSVLEAQLLYTKAVSIGLTRAAAELSIDFFINYHSGGWKTYITKKISFQGSDTQETAFKSLLTPSEAESLHIEKLGLSAGDACPDLQVYSFDTSESVLVHFTSDDPKVYLLLFWVSWCEDCQMAMTHNQEVLERNPDWAVEILTVALDEETEAPKALIQEKGWTKTTCYWGGEAGFKSAAATLLQVEEIPTCILVKKGTILWRGCPSERNLEADIDHLLRSDDLPKREEAESEIVYSDEQAEHMLVQVEEILSPLRTISPAYSFDYVLNVKVTQHELGQNAKSMIYGKTTAADKWRFEAIAVKIKELFPSLKQSFDLQEHT